MSLLAWLFGAVGVVLWIAAVGYTIYDLIDRDDVSGATKMAWVLLVVLLPLLGIVLYLLIGRRRRPVPGRTAP